MDQVYLLYGEVLAGQVAELIGVYSSEAKALAHVSAAKLTGAFTLPAPLDNPIRKARQ